MFSRYPPRSVAQREQPTRFQYGRVYIHPQYRLVLLSLCFVFSEAIRVVGLHAGRHLYNLDISFLPTLVLSNSSAYSELGTRNPLSSR